MATPTESESHMLKRSFRPIRTFAVALSLLSSGCGGSQAPAATGQGANDVPESERDGGTAVVALTSDIDDINPLTLSSTTANRVARSILFLPFFRPDGNFAPTPGLARSWELSADSTLLTFHLRDDVYWHDGTKTTAFDAKFTYDLLLDPETPYVNKGRYENFESAEAVDSFTFRVRLRPHADYLVRWLDFIPVPRHVLGKVPPLELAKHPFGTTRPVGNGPFKLVSRTPGQDWVLEANDRFPEDLGGRPHLDRLVFRVVPDPTTQMAELLTGASDIVTVTPDQQEKIASARGVRLISYQSPAYNFIAWNGRRPLFSDPRVRRALTMAIDRQGIVDGLLNGHGTVANSTVPPMFWNHDPTAGVDLLHDPAAARRSLGEAGWLDRDGDGILEDSAGREFRFTLQISRGNPLVGDVGAKVQADLRKIGIVADLRTMEAATMMAQAQNPGTRDFDAVLTGFNVGASVNDTDLFHCSRRDNPFQMAGFCDPEIDRLLDTLPRIVSRSAANPLWQEYQRKLAQAQPFTLLYYLHAQVGVADRLRDVVADARGPWANAADWWIHDDGGVGALR